MLRLLAILLFLAALASLVAAVASHVDAHEEENMADSGHELMQRLLHSAPDPCNKYYSQTACDNHSCYWNASMAGYHKHCSSCTSGTKWCGSKHKHVCMPIAPGNTCCKGFGFYCTSPNGALSCSQCPLTRRFGAA